MQTRPVALAQVSTKTGLSAKERKRELMGAVKAGGFCNILVQVSGFDSKLKNEKLPCDMISHDR